MTAAAGRTMELDQKVEAIRTAWQTFCDADLPALEKTMLKFIA
ncbi:MAG TPA: hypothetical protein VMB48_12180 [Steroidobacteraceae bacterium]|nr:hypothetical protein [Steroidobacteraceae bacterium]